MISAEFESKGDREYAVSIFPEDDGMTTTFISIPVFAGDETEPGIAVAVRTEDSVDLAAMIMASHGKLDMREDNGRTIITVGKGPLQSDCVVPDNQDAAEWMANTGAALLMAVRTYHSNLEREAATEDAEQLDEEARTFYNAYYGVEDSLDDIRNTDELGDWSDVARAARKLYAK